MSLFPDWVVVGVGIVLLTFVALILTIFVDMVRARPIKRVRVGGSTISVWVRERRMPGGAGAIVAPVSPDLKMVAGIAKWVRDATADQLQRQAAEAAPLAPGEVFAGAGGRYRFGIGILAVVMDAQKRTSADFIRTGVTNAIRKARERDARTVVVPDFTEDLLSQPSWITDEQRRDTCASVARAMVEGILEAGVPMDDVRIWVWKRGNEEVFIAELERAEAAATAGTGAAPSAA